MGHLSSQKRVEEVEEVEENEEKAKENAPLIPLTPLKGGRDGGAFCYLNTLDGNSGSMGMHWMEK